MQELLIRKLHDYLGDNHPDLLIKLQSEGKVLDYLKGKITSVDSMMMELIRTDTDPYFIEELCMFSLTADLRPSRYNCVKEIFEEEFKNEYLMYYEMGILRFELVNMVESLHSIFDALNFSEANAESRLLRYAICGAIQNYIESKKWN
ncbi:MAG: DUF1896 family protein [Chitinophagaceae bacterium]